MTAQKFHDIKEVLIDKVLEQIVNDVHNADLTAIEEMLKYVPINILEGFLSEVNNEDI